MKPSWMTSTYSVCTLICVLAYVALCLWQKDMTSLKDLTLLLLGGVGIIKGSKMANGGGVK